ncbi:cytochrome c [bacterium]|nr:cytochrome c [bacterium]
MRNKLSFLTIVCMFVATALSSCSAYDLGSAGNYYYDIGAENITNPTWEGGISAIVEKKCATCHTAESPWYKPKNVDTNANSEKLKKIATQDFWKQDSIMSVIKECLEATCGVEKVPMPPKYATPLSKNEKEALINFAKKYTPAASAGFSAKFATCEGCHGSKGAGQGTFPKLAGTALTLDQFKAVIRAGRGGMPVYSTTQYSDADLASDHAELKKLP